MFNNLKKKLKMKTKSALINVAVCLYIHVRKLSGKG